MLVFRLNEKDIEVGRAKTDEPESHEPLGYIRRLSEGGYTMTADLRESCSTKDLEALKGWIGKLSAFDRDTEALEDAITSLRLPQTLATAERWLATTDHPEASYIALRITAAMQALEAFLDAEAPVRIEAAATQTASVPEVKGCIDKVTPRLITGWAMQMGTEQPCEIQVRINDDRVLKILADYMRPDILEHGLHPTGNCGFRLELSSDEALAPGDQVRAYAGPSGTELRNSPSHCKGPSQAT
ncbi:hypothetical protein G3480_03570 [Thiorhodococcus mannitoliphagus]|uniref:Uncharacterized protein n=1 Tax=Thiorhodococcus mannitoliphagus TaxID=329406 RepID=A0A6P1DTP0_9GAMM|nr:hypothetical protein [Thiorhodococcus mannitoliphagus]NEX19402.1 hypothetical protein [Thiorhodococcus mannitoliphagus]